MHDNKDHTQVNNLHIAYIGGGSRGWAWNLMADLAMEPNLSGTVHLYDIDRKAAEQNEAIGNRLSSRTDAVGKWHYTVSETLGHALAHADFVVISIQPGTFTEMESDVHTPEAYGIYQSVGDTVGAGGFVRGLRTIPMFVEIAEAIRQYAPDAWVINYTNPMTLCVRTLYQVFPAIKAFGCCHEVFGTQKLLATALAEICDIPNVSRHEIDVNVLGINHFTWLDRASYRGMDLFPVYRAFCEKYAESGYEKQVDDNWMNRCFGSAERVKMDLFLRYGLIAAAGDRHLAEFVPGSWYLKDPETVAQWKFGLTPVSYRWANLKERLERSARLVNGAEEIELKHSGEEGIQLMKALLGLGQVISNVNLPNCGQIRNLPLDAVVETNAVFTRDSISPVMAGALPQNILQLVLRHVCNQEAELEAVLRHDRNAAFHAFLNDPQINLPVQEAKVLFDTMLDHTRDYLPAEF